MANLVAKAEIYVEASADRVWRALTDPAEIKQYMFGTDVETDWQPGSPITWSGEYEGKPYQDKGKVVAVEAGKRLKVTHYSPMGGKPDTPENYHAVTYELSENGNQTHVVLSQDNNGDAEEQKHASDNWQMVLDGLKKVVQQA